MKKLILALILIALIVGALAACGGPSYLEEFNELIEEIEQLREYRFESTAVISLDAAFLGDTAFAFADFMPMHFAIDGTVSDINRQMQATYRHRQADGTLMFDMSMLLTDQHMYVGLVSMVDYMLRPVFEVLGVDMDRFSAEALLGGYAYLIVPYAGRLEDMVFTPAALTDGVEIEPFLARQGNAFVITALGEDVRALTDGISSLLAQFIMPDATLDGADAIGDVISDISAQLTGTNLAEARVVIVTAHEENSFHQTVELQVPGFIDLRANFSLTAQGVAPVAVPGNALTETEFANLLL
ncbi:MAG: hypothetical protein FWD84_05120, partial [Oscillospiraceae bacterium]|nr:hypothetical protein [Oscillospiraceae bacterium]